MRKSSLYCKKTLRGIPYLLPVGRGIVQGYRSFRLNSTAEWLYDRVVDGRSVEEIVQMGEEQFQIKPEELVPFQQQLEQFLRFLEGIGAILRDEIVQPDELLLADKLPQSDKMFQSDEESLGRKPYVIEIASIPLCLYAPEEVVEKSLRSFEKTDMSKINVKDFFSVGLTEITLDNTQKTNSKFAEICNEDSEIYKREGSVSAIFETEEVLLLKGKASYRLLFKEYNWLKGAGISDDKHLATFFYDGSKEPDATQLFHGLRFAFLMEALQHGICAVHSASFLYQNKIWLFSAPSGTGKTTHVNLWKSLWPEEVELINGDLNLVRGGTVYGSPWCGTSHTFRQGQWELGGIFLLERGKENRVEQIEGSEACAYLLCRVISPMWDEKMLEEVVGVVEDISEKVPILRLYCTPEEGAAVCVKDYLYHSILHLS